MPHNECSQPKIWQDANCHCRAISYRVLLPPLVSAVEPQKVMACTCSFCTKNGLLNVYSHRSEVLVRLPGGVEEKEAGSFEMREAFKDVLGYYVRNDGGEGEMENVFCKLCGSSLWTDVKGGATSVGARPGGDEWYNVVAINARMFKSVYTDDLTLNKSDVMREAEPKYD